MRSWRREGAASRLGSGRDGFGLNRREILAGGIGAGALIALPDLGSSGHSGVRPTVSDGAAFRHAFLYGTPDPGSSPGASVVAVLCPASRAAPRHGPVKVATNLAAAPVSSPDETTTALTTVHRVDDGARVTLTLIDAASAAIAQQGSVTVTGVPDGANILRDPGLRPWLPDYRPSPGHHGASEQARDTQGGPAHRRGDEPVGDYLEVASCAGLFRPRQRRLHGTVSPLRRAVSRVVHRGRQQLRFGAVDDQGAAAQRSCREPGPSAAVPGGRVPLGSGRARFSGPTPAPWPGGEPVVPLPNGDVARLVRGRDVQVFSARTGTVTELAVAPLSRDRAKPSAVTMQGRPDGTVFMTKPGVGVAVIADPADSSRAKAHLGFPVPASPYGAPWSKASWHQRATPSTCSGRRAPRVSALRRTLRRR